MARHEVNLLLALAVSKQGRRALLLEGFTPAEIARAQQLAAS